MKIGIIKEGKIPPDNRTPLTPKYSRKLMDAYPELDIKVEYCPYRCFSDEEYKSFGVEVVESVADADILLGIKEVPIEKLIEGKTYFFFSHTIKKQAYNRKLLQAVLHKNITLIDYEMLTDNNGKRLIGFGKWAGIVGAHYALLMYGRRYGKFSLKPAVQCVNMQEMIDQYHHLQLPSFKCVITGGGRVAEGALEIMKYAEVTEVSKEDYLNREFDKPVFCQLHSDALYARKEDFGFDKQDFYHHPEKYKNTFRPYIPQTDILINCMFWSPLAPRLFEVSDIEKPDFCMKTIADISCDIDGSVPITYRSTTIADPVYGVDCSSKNICQPYRPDCIDVMAVGNLPNELPKDASKGFAKVMMETFIPLLLKEEYNDVLERATITRDGMLTKTYAYLQDFVDEKE